MNKHTPGPWEWMGNELGLSLATTQRVRIHVMGFKRKGMQKAVNQPLGFLKSVVQSGEGWTEIAQERYSEATAKLDAALTKAKPE